MIVMMPDNEHQAPKSSRFKRKIFVWVAAFAAIAALVAAISPYAVRTGSLIIYNILGSPHPKTAIISIVPIGSKVVKVGEIIRAAVEVDSANPINVVAATVKLPSGMADMEESSQADTIVNLWIRKPSWSIENGTLEFGGGIRQEGGYAGSGKILNMAFKTVKSGRLLLEFASATVLAHDGKGSELLGEKKGAVFYVIGNNDPSPDLDGDGKLGMGDVAAFMVKLARNDKAADFNRDGKVTWSDLSVLRTLIKEFK
jgi:hypothetical protein